MKFEYSFVETSEAEIEIDDIGNCALQVFDAHANSCILIIQTILGETKILTYGPFNVDIDVIDRFRVCAIRKLDFNETQIIKAINKFLGNNDINVIQCVEIEKEKALDIVKNLGEYL